MVATNPTHGSPYQERQQASADSSALAADDIERLVALLPGCTEPHKRDLLPLLLQDWGARDLQEHRTRATPREIQHERRQILAVAKRSRELKGALEELDPDCRFYIASRMVEAIPGQRRNRPGPRAIRRREYMLKSSEAKLEQLVAAAEEAAERWRPVTRQHRTLIRFLILEDLAQIFEWATGARAARRVHTDDRPGAGKEYGPFWDFASTGFAILFGSSVGLSTALRNWSQHRTEYDVTSPLIANMQMRHPEWRLREP